MHVDIEARQPAWVAITDASGKRLMARIFEDNETRSLELTDGATLRTGNAGGLIVRFNGKEIGPLGPPGKVRDISFKDGVYKIHAPDAGSAPAPLKT
jgi:cytoskeleton protein RodZ